MTRRTVLLVTGVVLLIGAGAFLLLRPAPEAERAGGVIAALQRPTPPAAAAPPRVRRSRIPPPPDVSALQVMVRSTDWRVRRRAAGSLAERRDLPPERRAELLLDVLEQEVATPAKGPPPAGSYLPLTGVMRLHYVHLVGDLGGPATGPARAAVRDASGERREWTTIALGATGAKEAVPGLRELLRGSRHTDVRMSAAYFLGELHDRSAVDDLKAALRDPGTARVVSDVSGAPDRALYPVREQAARALRTLGVSVERRGSTFTAL